MYSVRVEPGKERIQVRHFTNGFLPSYISAEKGYVGKHMLVIPGYIFTMTKTGGAERVPDSEWDIIEAISSKMPSVLDESTEQIADGPLKGLPVSRADLKNRAVLIRAKLFGFTRDYWLPVRLAEDLRAADAPVPEEKPAEGSEEKAGEKAKGRKPAAGKAAKKEKAAYTEEQRARMLAKAEEIGVKAAADSFGVPWQVIAQMKRRAAEAAAGETAEKKAVRARAAAREADALKADAKEADAVGAVAPAEAEKPAGEKAEETASPLALENAVLKEKIARLEEKAAQLKKALAAML